jgi:polyhydroxyalkanoate synthesis repressor PhaR
MSEARIIKKYPNRRLYDTGRSCYIRLEDVHKLVGDRIQIVVLDQRSGKDITQAVLMQTLAALEEKMPQLLGVNALLELIRRHGTAEATDTAIKLHRVLNG